MKKLLKAALAVVVLALLAWVVWPARIDPVAWTPGPLPKPEGAYAENSRLKNVQRFGVGVGVGPEGIAVDTEGRIYAGYADGRVVMFSANGASYQQLADTHGRPLGISVGGSGGPVIADAYKGLLQIEGGTVTPLATEAGGKAILFADDADRASDGSLYFSDVSARFNLRDDLLDVLEHRCTGRLIRYTPADRKSQVLLDDLCFANGVAVGPDDAYVLVNETAAYRIRRYWLKGDKAGTADVFIDNLPGLPDNLSVANGRVWVALYAPRDPLLDHLLPGPAFVKKLVSKLPRWLQPDPAGKAWVLALNLQGQVIANLQDFGPNAYAPITSVEERGPWLYFGSLTADSLARLPLNTVVADAPSPPPGWQQTPAKPHHFEPPKLGYNPPESPDGNAPGGQ